MLLECRPLLRLAWLALLPLFLAVGLLLADVSPAHAATIVVNSTGEDFIQNGQCTLVEALNNANNNNQMHPDCVAGSGADTVELGISPGFDPNFGCNATTRVCTIVISGTYLITDPVTIDGYTQAQASPNTLAVGSNAVIKIRLLPKPGSSVATGLRVQANNVTIRGLAIGGYSTNGILVDGGSNTRIVGCFIGTDASGTQAVPNRTGIYVVPSGRAAIIGGFSPADRNLISGNLEGISVENTFGVTIWGNAIGTNAAGTAGIPNSIGVLIRGNSNTVGGTGPGEGNVIAYNSGPGVQVTSMGVRILGNAIFSNGQLGIDLGGDGVTPNDPGDADPGPNRSQNFPVLADVGAGAANTTVHGTLNSTPNRTFRIEVFASTECDTWANYGEGQELVGFVNVTTDGAGNGSFIGSLQPVPAGRFIAATATDLTTVDTSEFSACTLARLTDFTVQSPSNSGRTTEANEGSPFDAEFAVALITRPAANVAVSVSVSDPTEGALVTPTTLTFTPTNGTTAQWVRLRGVDDALDDGDIPYTVVLGPASSADANYNGKNPPDVGLTNVDNDDRAAQCGPRPKVNVSVAKIGGGQLRATVSVSANPNTQNELQAVTWTRFDTATVVLDGGGPVQVGQQSNFAPLTQAASFVITRTPGASSGTVRLAVTDVCGGWPTFVVGGPRAW